MRFMGAHTVRAFAFYVAVRSANQRSFAERTTTRLVGSPAPTTLLTEGVFVAQRVLFGLLLPASLGYFTWKTILMRSTQSATGILYVVVFLTLVGEALSVYLSLVTQIPI